jgi:hypothetical protein
MIMKWLQRRPNLEVRGLGLLLGSAASDCIILGKAFALSELQSQLQKVVR